MVFYLIFFFILLAGALSFYLKKLDFLGAVSGTVLAFVLWAGGGLESLFALFLFFVVGTAATSWKKHAKSMTGLAEKNDGVRGISNVFANGGIPLFLALFALIFPVEKFIFSTMIASSFAVACSDTLSSELGNVYGKNHFNILNFKQATKGKDGVVSMFGFAVGIIGACIIALGDYLFYFDLQRFMIISACGFLGNIVDSVLGATLQQKGYLNNHQVNFFATLSGALLCYLLI